MIRSLHTGERSANANKTSKTLARIEHVLQKVATLTLGRMYVQPLAQALRRKRRAHRAHPDVSHLKVGIVAHVHYPELLGEILDCQDQIPVPSKLIVTVNSDASDQVREALRHRADAFVLDVANRGRDIAPFLQVLNSGMLDTFDAVLKIHTKRSVQLLDGATRRRLLYAKLSGDPYSAAHALAQFSEPKTGIVGWSPCFRSRPEYMMRNRPLLTELSKRLGYSNHIPLGFFEGSMFWFRPESLQPLRLLNIADDDFEEEQGQVDGTIAHAIERAFTIAAWRAGFEVRGLSGQALSPHILTIE